MTCHSKEIWKPINNYSHYLVSSHGRIKNKHGRILKQTYKERGDAIISFHKNGKRSTHRVARIVAQTFLEEDGKRNEVNHIDGNPRNNHISNLEWVTRHENIAHARRLGLYDDGKEVNLYCMFTKKTLNFKSRASASRYLGRSNGFIKERIRANNLIVDKRFLICDYEI